MSVDRIRIYVNGMFADFPRTNEVIEAKQNIVKKMEEKYTNLIDSGMAEEMAFSSVVNEFGNIEDIKNSFASNDKENDFFDDEIKSEVKDGDFDKKEQTNRRENIYSKREETSNSNEKKEYKSIFADNVSPSQKKKIHRIKQISGYISGIFMLVAMISFLVLGVFGYWHPSWVIIPVGGLLCGVIGCISDIRISIIAGRKKNISSSIGGIIILLCLGTYLTMGVVFNMWHPFWIIVLYGIFLCWFINALDIHGEKKGAEKAVSIIDSLIMLLATIVFFEGGIRFSLWHPLWIAFPIGGLLCGVVSIIKDIITTKKDD